jgi:hypothetical protein
MRILVVEDDKYVGGFVVRGQKDAGRVGGVGPSDGRSWESHA